MSGAIDIKVESVTTENWRAVRDLQVATPQRAFVEEPIFYLALCAYTDWNPCAIVAEGSVVGFMMWAVDDDGSVWLGGIFVDACFQQQGHGRRATEVLMGDLAPMAGDAGFALSYRAENLVAAALYARLGFAETGEVADDEIVARLRQA